MTVPHGSARLLAVLLLVPLVAGCTGGAEVGPGASPSDDGGTTDPTTPPGPADRVSGFTIEGPTLATEEGRAPPFHEDDVVVVRYTLRNDADAAATFLVTLKVDGEVADVDNLRLEPGASKDHERRLEDLRDRDALAVEIRAGASSASANATVETWPRTGAWTDLGPAKVRVNRWLKNASDGGTDVNVTVERKPLPEGDYSMLRAAALCVDPQGRVHAEGYERPRVPEPGASAMTDVHLPGCDDMLYGVEFTGQDAAGKEIRARILFVEEGWRPPGAEA